ncbi:hypothetical protein [Rubellicoccus peritrichatus]|uniref:Uncharacterized protein n=1 Tax=Rubellicoccus peritrichatus TaxID=3080537 RepID=A0AAQ3LCV5_9BACT|nr:hypothetical protein [Puniceicoccus sp. CR14]WOO41560.1 hypothetical protein RZN69_00565 [Puniceicoccus sp. CR14]
MVFQQIERSQRKGKKWLIWVIVGLLLFSMIGYVLTLDEAVDPLPESEEAID